MEAFFNNSQVLYSRVKKVIDELAEEKPFGDLKDGEIIDRNIFGLYITI